MSNIKVIVESYIHSPLHLQLNGLLFVSNVIDIVKSHLDSDLKKYTYSLLTENYIKLDKDLLILEAYNKYKYQDDDILYLIFIRDTCKKPNFFSKIFW